MIRSESRRLAVALAIQFLFAGLAVLATWEVFGKFGSTFFVEYSSISAVFLIVNYFDFGAIGVARRIGAQSALSDVRRLSQLRSCLVSILRKLAIVPVAAMVALAAIVLANISELGGIGFLRSLLLAAAASPVFVGVGILRGYLEGAGQLGWASFLRGANGLLISGAPLLVNFLWRTPHPFFLVPPLVAFALVGGLLFVVRNRGSNAEVVPIEFKIVGRIELVYTLAGVLFLYLDRYVIGLFGKAEQGGGYLLALEMAARASLLYVPIVMNVFPEMVRRSESDPGSALSLVGANATKAALAVAGAFLCAIAVGWLFRGKLPPGMTNCSFVSSFALVSLAYVVTVGSFSFQKFIGVNSRGATSIAQGYSVLLAVDVLAVVILTWKVGAVALPVVFLGRSVLEWMMLRTMSTKIVQGMAVA